MKFNMLFTICPTDHINIIVDATKKKGATGATILSARGTGHKEAATFFGMKLERQVEAIVMLVEKHKTLEIMETIYNVGQMKKPGNGICFSLPVDAIMGLESQLEILKEDAEDYL